MWLALVFIGFLWLCRLLYFRFSSHHAIAWQRNVRYEQNLWWEEHQSLIGLKDILLLGPAGAETMDWQRVLRRIQRPPLNVMRRGKHCVLPVPSLLIVRNGNSSLFARW
jgi:hypothetical protein